MVVRNFLPIFLVLESGGISVRCEEHKRDAEREAILSSFKGFRLVSLISYSPILGS
jgi:hypothetical protein